MNKEVLKEKDYHPSNPNNGVTYDYLRNLVIAGALGEAEVGSTAKNLLALVGAGTLLYIGFKFIKNFAIMSSEIRRALRS